MTPTPSSSRLELAGDVRDVRESNDADAGAWWCGNASTESELLSAAVLCAAIAATTSNTLSTSTATIDGDDNNDDNDLVRARKALEAAIRQSPLPHDLLFPVLEFHHDYVVMETSRSIVCAVRATKHRDILETVLGSTMPLAQPFEFRFGGARVHVPFWTRAQRLDLHAASRRAKRAKKTLLLCGHSIGGSIAHLGFCELVYQHLPTTLRLQLERMDYEQKKRATAKTTDTTTTAAPTLAQTRAAMQTLLDAYVPDRSALLQSLPDVLAVGFGSPYSCSDELVAFLEPLGMAQRTMTFVNELDCIPSILNVAQSAAMLAKTTERLVTISKATKTLLNLLPAKMQSVLTGLSATGGGGAGGVPTAPTATAAYVAMSLTILQNTFQKLRDLNIVKDASALAYAPCGTYIFLAKASSEFDRVSDPLAIAAALHAANDATTTLTGNSLLQHRMSAYVDAVAKRCTAIQINATMNYYERLRVGRTATPREIRSAYRRLALKWHPDRWSAHRRADASSTTLQEREMAENVFKLLAESYEVLSDPAARRAYDAHLAEAPSLTEEFVRDGTVNGMTLDEAITVFREMVDRGSSVVARATSRFSSSSSSVVGQKIRRAAPTTAEGSTKLESLVVNNHDNLFAPDRIRVARQDKITYVQPDELVPTDVAAPTGRGTTKPQAAVGLKTISVVGGAVAVGASVALIVSAWSQYSESSKRKRQATTVRNMSGNHLLLLMEDHVSSERALKAQAKKKRKLLAKREQAQQTLAAATTTEATEAATERSLPLQTIAESTAERDASTDDAQPVTTLATVASASTNALVDVHHVAANGKTEDVDDDDDDAAELQELALLDEFFECTAECDAAALEAFAEDEFYDCVDLAEDMAEYFPDAVSDNNNSNKDAPLKEQQQTLERAALIEPSDARVHLDGGVLFPVGSTVQTPFGLGVVERWRDNSSSAAIRLNAHTLAYIQKRDLQRGSRVALAHATQTLEAKRAALAERVVRHYKLDDETNTARANFHAIVRASKDGALDSGLRAAGGVALAKGMARTTSRLGGAVAAPLTIASILVDIGKEYYAYRSKHTERKTQGVLSTTSERLLMKDFRLKAGQHIAGGTAAAAGASLGAYSVASAVGFWTGVGIAGPIGVVAATGAAVVGGMLGFFAGTNGYKRYTASYFHSHRHAKEHIDRLELGARVLFNEFDVNATGAISKRDCIQIMTKLYEASSAVSDAGYQQTVDVLESDQFVGPVTWSMFWEWVSTEAARSLRTLEEAKQHDATRESWWASYVTYFSYSSATAATSLAPGLTAAAAAAELADPQSCMYPSVYDALQFMAESTVEITVLSTEESDSGASSLEVDDINLVVLRAQLEALVDSGDLTVGDSYQLSDALEANDADVRLSARRTIAALQNGQVDSSGATANSIVISEGFAGSSSAVNDDNDDTAIVPARAAGEASSKQTVRVSNEALEVDVLCSLLSTHGLREYLHAHDIEPTAETRRHEDLHCLALQATTTTTAAAASNATTLVTTTTTE